MEKPGAAAGNGSFALDLPICLLPLLVCLHPGKKYSKEQLFPAGDILCH